MTQHRKILRGLQRAILALLLVLTFSSTSQAGPLGVPIEPYPVILVGFITSSYDATTGTFLSDGFMRTLDDGTGRVSYPNNPFRLSANINGSGEASGGYFTIDGGALLGSWVLLDVGFDAVAGGVLEFLFGPATGSLVSDGTYDAAEPIDVLFGPVGGFPGSFGSSWTSTTYASALIREDPVPLDGGGTVPVPEPSTLVLTLTAVGLLGLTRRRARLTV